MALDPADLPLARVECIGQFDLRAPGGATYLTEVNHRFNSTLMLYSVQAIPCASLPEVGTSRRAIGIAILGGFLLLTEWEPPDLAALSVSR